MAVSTSPGDCIGGHVGLGVMSRPGFSSCRTILPRAARRRTRRDAPAKSSPPPARSVWRMSAPKIFFSSAEGSRAFRLTQKS